ncbi:hypothetical protein HIM_01755 [Hirsutella minnesotensis 3608]|nr:hypothetical protein HIM_01755 [Hirsutella minnesotensis 3608]
MAVDDDSSDLSSLSSLSPAPSDDELDRLSPSPSAQGGKRGLLKFFSKLSEQASSEPLPPPRKRSPSPPHEYVLADNPDIAFIVMFRSRFSDAFPKSLAHFGPQELERDVVESVPGDRVEHFLCALLGLLLNRKQDVKPGHYGRALEDAIASHKGQWPPSWEDKNPLSGGASFNSMTPAGRLTLLRTLILWTLASSDVVKGLINQSYKQNRHEDDLNQPRSIQPWGSDADKRRYFLVEGQDDTHFRVYRESNHAGANRTWWSVAGSITELRALAAKLETKDGGPKARSLGQKIMAAIPRFEAGEEKRKRREYRQSRKEQFKRPEPGYSLYEGRTRGKRMKYTYSDDEDIFSDSTGNRRSARNTGANTPAEMGPVTTSSGRQVRAPPRLNMVPGESAPGSVQGDASEYEKEEPTEITGRPRRTAAAQHGTNGWKSHERSGDSSADSDDDEGSEAEYGDDEDDADALIPEEYEDEEGMDEDEMASDDRPRSLVVRLSVKAERLRDICTEDRSSNSSPSAKVEEEQHGATCTKDIDMAEAGDMPAKDSISVADEPAKEPEHSLTAMGDKEPNETSPPNHSNIASATAATELAFRGSPEKKSRQGSLANGGTADDE